MHFLRTPLSLLFLLALGCEMPLVVEESVQEVSPEALELVAQVEGTWRIEGILTNTCPDEWTTLFPQGETRWTHQDEQLQIENIKGGGQALHFWPQDETTLVKTMSVSRGDCEGTQRLELVFLETPGNTAMGFFTSEIEVHAGPLCPLNDLEDSFPCQTQFQWQGMRR